MKDRLGQHAWVNMPLQNPTQNAYVRLQRMPQGELPDLLGVYNKAWDAMMAEAVRDRVGEK